jgi:hypothetical protein
MAEATVTDLATRKVTERQELAQAIMQVDASGKTILAIPPALSGKFNVLAPSAVITQGSSFFTPSFTVVTLNPDPEAGADFYKLQGKLAPTKVGLQKLGDAAGISWDPDKSCAHKGEVEIIELPGGKKMRVDSYTYHAVGYVRKPDGTLKALTADEEWQPQIALMEIEASSSSGQYGKTPGTPEYNAKVEKEFLFSAKKRAQMIRSKAMNGVLRQALSIKQAYTAQEAAKSFLVISHAWSPDTEDPATLAMVASLVGADTAALYGPGATQAALPEPEEDFTEGEAGEDIPFAEPDPDVDASGADAETGEVIEGEVVDDTDITRLEQLAEHVLAVGAYRGETMGSVFAKDPDYFQNVANWNTETLAAGKPIAPPTAAQIALMAEFVALFNRATSGGEAL